MAANGFFHIVVYAIVDISDGRMYSGGLAKFEPREVERLVVPSPDALEGKLWE